MKEYGCSLTELLQNDDFLDFTIKRSFFAIEHWKNVLLNNTLPTTQNVADAQKIILFENDDKQLLTQDEVIELKNRIFKSMLK